MAGLFGWGARRPEEAPAPESPPDTTLASVVFPHFLAAVTPRQAPVVLDLGPAVGANVSFLGERLACKLLIGDLCNDIREGREESAEQRRAATLARLERTVGSDLDAVLCWNTFDYLDRACAQAVAEFLVSRLRAGGVIHGYFSSTSGELDRFTRYVIEGPSALVCREEVIARRKRCVLSTRDLAALFAGTKVMDSVLLKSQRREILLKKG